MKFLIEGLWGFYLSWIDLLTRESVIVCAHFNGFMIAVKGVLMVLREVVVDASKLQIKANLNVGGIIR
jgi:hypothetical protein